MVPVNTGVVKNASSQNTLCSFTRNRKPSTFMDCLKDSSQNYSASRKKGVTGEMLLQLLESRLDNTVYRLGIAPTRRAARQLVLHKHISVNGEIVNISSYSLKPGDVVAVRERSKSLEVVTNSLAAHNARRYNWLEWDNNEMAGKMINLPLRADIPENINEQLIVELYSK